MCEAFERSIAIPVRKPWNRLCDGAASEILEIPEIPSDGMVIFRVHSTDNNYVRHSSDVRWNLARSSKIQDTTGNSSVNDKYRSIPYGMDGSQDPFIVHFVSGTSVAVRLVNDHRTHRMIRSQQSRARFHGRYEFRIVVEHEKIHRDLVIGKLQSQPVTNDVHFVVEVLVFSENLFELAAGIEDG